MADFDFSKYELENVTTGEKVAFRHGGERAIDGCIRTQTDDSTPGKVYSKLEGVIDHVVPFFDMFITPALYKSLGSPPPPVYKAGDPIYEFLKSKYTPEIQSKIARENRVLVFKTTGFMDENMPAQGYFKLVPKAAAAAAATMMSDAATTSSAPPPPRRSKRNTTKGGKRRIKKSRKSKKSKKSKKSRK